MRSILALSALAISLAIFCGSADAASRRHSRPVQHRARPEHAITAPDFRQGYPSARGYPSPGGYPPPRGYAVPGWTDQETQKWLDDATREVGVGG
jgi:hypothetical protein